MKPCKSDEKFVNGVCKPKTVDGLFNISGEARLRIPSKDAIDTTFWHVISKDEEGNDTFSAFRKPLYRCGHLKDLFKFGDKKLEIKNRHGEVIRTIWKEGNKVKLDAMTPSEPVLELDENTEILYEPWHMDVGSLVFRAPNTLQRPLAGTILKLATEKDEIIYEKEVTKDE